MNTPEEPQTAGATGENAKINNLQVMVVDDNEINTIILADFLTSRNMRVESVMDGEEFLERVEEIQPDIIIMDIQMPGIDGLEAIRRLRARPNAGIASVPVIAVTALAMVGDREKCLAAGANDYVSKPFNLRQLLEIIEYLIAGGSPTGS